MKTKKIFKIIFIINIVLMSFPGCSSVPEKENNPTKDNLENILTIETSPEIKADNHEIFPVDVKISALGNEIYPAMSMCIDFDASVFEFTGIEDGNIFITGDTADGQLPEWNVNTESANETGQINIMYLDITGGRYAFSDKFINNDKNILLRLDFCLRDNAESGDTYEISVKDAVFAASDSEKSLSSSAGTLKIQNGKITLED